MKGEFPSRAIAREPLGERVSLVFPRDSIQKEEDLTSA